MAGEDAPEVKSEAIVIDLKMMVAMAVGMDALQQAYFKSRKQEDLVRAKTVERFFRTIARVVVSQTEVEQAIELALGAGEPPSPKEPEKPN